MLLLLLLLLHVVLVVVAPVMAGLRAEAVACAVGGRRHGDGVDVRAATNQSRVKINPIKDLQVFLHSPLHLVPPAFRRRFVGGRRRRRGGIYLHLVSGLVHGGVRGAAPVRGGGLRVVVGGRGRGGGGGRRRGGGVLATATATATATAGSIVLVLVATVAVVLPRTAVSENKN